MALMTCGENRRRSTLASAAMRSANGRGNDMVFLTVGVGMGLGCGYAASCKTVQLLGRLKNANSESLSLT